MADTTVAIPNDQQSKDKSAIKKESDKSPTDDEEEEEGGRGEGVETHGSIKLAIKTPHGRSSGSVGEEEMGDSSDELPSKKEEEDDDEEEDDEDDDNSTARESDVDAESLLQVVHQPSSDQEGEGEEPRDNDRMETESLSPSSVCDSREDKILSSPPVMEVEPELGGGNKLEDGMEVEDGEPSDRCGSPDADKDEADNESQADSSENEEEENKEVDRRPSTPPVGESKSFKAGDEKDTSDCLSSDEAEKQDETDTRHAVKSQKRRKTRKTSNKKEEEVVEESTDEESGRKEKPTDQDADLEMGPIVLQVCSVLPSDDDDDESKSLFTKECESRVDSAGQSDSDNEEPRSSVIGLVKGKDAADSNEEDAEEPATSRETKKAKGSEKQPVRRKSVKASKAASRKGTEETLDEDVEEANKEAAKEEEEETEEAKDNQDDTALREDKSGTKDRVRLRPKRTRQKDRSKSQRAVVQNETVSEAEESEMPTLAILDVRTIVGDDDSNSASSATTAEVKDAVPEKEAHDKDDAGDGSNEDSNDSNKSDSENKANKESGEKPSGIEAIANKLTKKSKQANEENEMKNYATDTMNELLGLFGYEKVDESTKDSIQLSNNLSGPSKPKSEIDGDKSSAVPKVENSVSTIIESVVNQESQTITTSENDGGGGGDDDNEAKKEDTESAKTADAKKGEKVSASGSATKGVTGRTCTVCGKTKSCKYQVLMLGTTKFLCDDNCFREFRTKQNITTAPTIKDIIAENRPITRSLTNPKDHCNVCHKEIKNGMGLLPGVGENKPLCSEECMKNYHATQGLKRACAQCGNHIQSRSKCLTWEAMEFCNEECLGKYQSYLGSHCAYCNNAVQQTSLGKYCVRFGSDIKQFCSNSCLEEFKKGLKVCSYCQKDISNGSEGFLAPVGEKGQFKEFCSQSCMEKYETMGSVTPSQPSIEQCSVCSKVTSVKVEVTFEGKVHKLCSEPCIAAFRYANKINTSICDTCHKFFDLDVTRQLTIQFEGSSKRFCTKACMNVFVLYHRKVVPCSWCKVKKYNFDMIERVDSNNHVQLFCSLNCLSLFRVSLNATSSRRIQCDFCHQVKPAQYHLTMSDASIRNFCSYNCVMQFQSQFTAVAPVINPQQSTRTTTTTTTASTTQSSTPVISSVMSLAPSQILSQPQQQQVNTSAQKAVVVRPQGLPVIPAVKNVVQKTISTQTLTPIITQQVVIKHPPAKPQKNKMLTCKPIVQTKGVSCKPHPCHKTTQTDEDCSKPVFIPVPVPIFVPVPMKMYTTPVPFPLPFPLPIPVPIFIPTTKNSAHSIFKQIKEIQQKIPDNPFEADLILMAEMVAEDSAAAKDKQLKQLTAGKRAEESVQKQEQETTGAVSDESSKQEEGFVVETSLPDSCPTPNAFGDAVLQMALRMASGMEEPVDLESALTSSETSLSQDASGATEENGGGYLRSQARNHKRSTSRGRGRGRKRARTDEAALEQSICSEAPTTPQAQQPPPTPTPPVAPLSNQFDFRPIGPPQLESNCVLKFSYGVNAWKHWVLQKNTQLEKASQTNRKLKLFKTDILQLTADELNYSLCLFVKEVRKPNGDEYAPDSIYYLCLGIQQYLFENGRIDNIFSDAYYEKFTECLNEVLQRYEGTLTSEGCFLSRIEEEILWECKQLGAHSPHVLLNTLMYFNTKYFVLKTVEDHLQLSFSHILKHWKKNPGSTGKGSMGGRNVLLRYYPPSQIKDSSRRRKETIPAFEQVENLENPLRCPVKLYEFYLSKCPESIKNRNDIFYLYPERSCVPDSPVWYSTMSLGKETIAKMLQRIRMVREVGEAVTTSS